MPLDSSPNRLLQQVECIGVHSIPRRVDLMRFFTRVLLPIVLSGVMFVGVRAPADPPESDAAFPVADGQGVNPLPPPLNPLPKELTKLIRRGTPLNPEKTVILDLKQKKLFLHTQVSCRSCVLEMLCCPEGQREHETILAVRSKAFVIHSGLLALGLRPGTPVEFSPEFKPPSGPEIVITLHWVDEDGTAQKTDAREWIRHTVHRYYARPLPQAPPGIKLPHDELRYDTFNRELLWYGPMSEEQRDHLLTLWDDNDYQAAIERFYEQSQSRPMKATFVFTGSRWDVFEERRQQRYAAEDGHLITVANFSSATIDIAEPSSASDGGQSYEGWTERIPPEGTPVILELAPVDDEAQKKHGQPKEDVKPNSPPVGKPAAPAVEKDP